MKFSCAILVIALLLVGSGRGFSQGFVNLNFESANVSGYSPGAPGATVPTQDAFPGWSAYFGPPGDATELSLSTVTYDGVTTGGAMISLQDSNAAAPAGPIQGSYSALLVGSIPGAETTTSLGQTGTIPGDAQSLVFWAYFGGSLDVSFDGQLLSFVAISNALNYTVYTANISAFAGQTGLLLFTAPVNTGTVLDNIQFSTSSVPEPGTLALCALGGLSLALRSRKQLSA